MHLSIQPSKTAPAHEHHALSHHPLIRVVLKKGPNFLWSVKDIMEATQLTERTVQEMLADGVISTITLNTRKESHNSKPRRKCTSGSLLIYLLKNSQEVPEAETLGALDIILGQLNDRILKLLLDHIPKLIASRASRAVIVCKDAAPKPADTQTELFPVPTQDAA